MGISPDSFTDSEDAAHRIWLGLVVALALVLRLIRLGTAAYWSDEVVAFITSDHLKQALTTGEYVSNHPPLFVVMTALWRVVGLDYNEWTMRLLPCLLGVAAIPAIYLLAKRLFGWRVGLAAAFLLAVSPFHVLHSQDLKEYILLPLTGTLAVYFLVEAMERNRPGQWALYALAVAVSCYSEVFAAQLLIGINLWALCLIPGRRDRLPGWIAANVAGVALFVPFLHVILRRADLMIVSNDAWWIPRPTLTTVAFYLKTLAFGYSALKPHFEIALVAFCLLVAAGSLLALRANWRAGLLLHSWFWAGVGLTFALSYVTQSVFLFRALLPFAIPFYILAAVALARIPTLPLKTTAVACLAALAAFSLVEKYQGRFCPTEFPHRPGIHAPVAYDDAARFIRERWQDQDLVVLTSSCTWTPLYRYGIPPEAMATAGLDNDLIAFIRRLEPPTTKDPRFQGAFMTHLEPLVAGRDRVWLVFWDWERLYLPGNATQIWRWMDDRFPERLHERFWGGLELFLYAKTQNGKAIEAIRRDQDDGVSCTITYNTEASTPYRKEAPDNALLPTPLNERRGALLLRFEETDQGAAPTSLAKTNDTRPVSFSLENRTSRQVACLVDVAATPEERPPSIDRALWPGDVVVPAGGVLHWTAQVDAKTRRVDIGAWERGRQGKGYRIFAVASPGLR